jgi:hypothetical protein
MGFGFVHKKKEFIKGEQGDSFGFQHKKRLNVVHPSQSSGVPVGGAFSDAFDSGSFWVGLFPSGTITKIGDFFFKHIKTVK